MANADYYAPGQWNFYCDLCGKKEKSGNGTRTWDGFYVCRSHKEQRNPQDFVRGVKDNQTVPWSRPEPPEQFLKYCTLRGSNALPGYGVPGCLYPSHVNLIFVHEALPQGPYTQAPPPPHGLNDLDYVFDSELPRQVAVQSMLPGHESEVFIKVYP